MEDCYTDAGTARAHTSTFHSRIRRFWSYCPLRGTGSPEDLLFCVAGLAGLKEFTGSRGNPPFASSGDCFWAGNEPVNRSCIRHLSRPPTKRDSQLQTSPASDLGNPKINLPTKHQTQSRSAQVHVEILYRAKSWHSQRLRSNRGKGNRGLSSLVCPAIHLSCGLRESPYSTSLACPRRWSKCQFYHRHHVSNACSHLSVHPMLPFCGLHPSRLGGTHLSCQLPPC